MPVNFLLRLHAGHADFARINDDHVIAYVDKRGVVRALFTSQNAGHTRSQPAQRLPLSIHHKPLARNFLPAWKTGCHFQTPENKSTKKDRSMTPLTTFLKGRHKAGQLQSSEVLRIP